jgi:hypothetical protein
MQTDHVELLHLHSVGERNLDTALSNDGAWRYILEQKAPSPPPPNTPSRS